MWATREKVDGSSDVTDSCGKRGLDGRGRRRRSCKRCGLVMQLDTSETGTRASVCDTHTHKNPTAYIFMLISEWKCCKDYC